MLADVSGRCVKYLGELSFPAQFNNKESTEIKVGCCTDVLTAFVSTVYLINRVWRSTRFLCC